MSVTLDKNYLFECGNLVVSKFATFLRLYTESIFTKRIPPKSAVWMPAQFSLITEFYYKFNKLSGYIHASYTTANQYNIFIVFFATNFWHMVTGMSTIYVARGFSCNLLKILENYFRSAIGRCRVP